MQQLINHDNKSDNVIAIYHLLEVRNELWVIVKDLEITPKINTFRILFEKEINFEKKIVKINEDQ